MQNTMKQAQLGVPHSRIQVELDFILQAWTSLILNFAENQRQSKSGKKRIFILQAWNCQILNFAENPRQSQSVQGNVYQTQTTNQSYPNTNL